MHRFEASIEGITEAKERAIADSRRGYACVYFDDHRTACFVRAFLPNSVKARGGYMEYPKECVEPEWVDNVSQPMTLDDVTAV